MPGVHLLNKITGSNVYLLEDKQLVLIDTGMPGNASRILSFINELGRHREELAYVFITHGHIDHSGSAAELRRLTGANIVAHKNEIVRTRDGRYVLRQRSERNNGIIMGALTYFGIFRPCPIDLIVEDGETFPELNGLHVFHTPGHTHGSISIFLEKNGVLFVGDNIINNEDRLSRPIPFNADKVESEQSLAKLTEIDFSICCFGHGPPLISEARNKVMDLSENYPRTPLWRRIVRNWQRLIRFTVRLWRR